MKIKQPNLRVWVVLHDLCMISIAWLASFMVRHAFAIPHDQWSVFFQTLPYVVVAQGLVLRYAGLYRGLWRFASIHDLSNIIRASLVGTAIVMVALFFVNRGFGVPRSAIVLYPLFLIFLLGGPRLFYRMWKDNRFRAEYAEKAKRVLVIGAGYSGEMLIRDMKREGEYCPVGFLDDNQRLAGANVHGLTVFGPIKLLPQIVTKENVDIVVIALPSATGDMMRTLVHLCETANVPFRTLPKLQDLVSGRSVLKELREVAIEDLLGRDPVKLDWKTISAGLAGKVVMISGGGGSIGSELCRQVARLGPSHLIVLERSEFNLYEIERELKAGFPNLIIIGHLIDVTEKIAVEHVMKKYVPHVVFHAAAYKHVPLLEEQVREAVKNNVLGTQTIAQAADSFGVGKFVLVSSDKAVNPTNVMGATKRTAEIYCQALGQHSKTKFVTVRFGNVLGSAGSVVPLFRTQIESGGPVTVTHPDITRYFMTIPEACQLILQAGAMGQGNEIFILDMGEPIKISYLAEQMIRLSGKTPGEDIGIRYTGLRPGEKLYEELFHDQEAMAETCHEKILLAQSRIVDVNTVEYALSKMKQYCDTYNDLALKDALKEVVPEMDTLASKPNSKNNVIPFERIS